MWFECASGSQIINGQITQPTPPTAEELNVWFAQYPTSPDLIARVWHRYLLASRSQDLSKWAARQWFFTNSTAAQRNILRLPQPVTR